MALKELQRIIPPPTLPTHVPTVDDWTRVEDDLGVAFPDDLRRLLAVYGMGTFRGTETTALGFNSPGHSSYVDGFRDECQRLRDIRGAKKTDDYPFDVFPDEGGLLPLALDENDVWLCWLTQGRPEEWPILIRWSWGSEGMRAFETSLSELLLSLFERRIELPCFPLPTFVDDVRFIPFEEGKTIGGDPIQ